MKIIVVTCERQACLEDQFGTEYNGMVSSKEGLSIGHAPRETTLATVR